MQPKPSPIENLTRTILRRFLHTSLIQPKENDATELQRLEVILDFMEEQDPQHSHRVSRLIDDIIAQHHADIAPPLQQAADHTFDTLYRVATGQEELPALKHRPDLMANNRRLQTPIYTWNIDDLINYRRDYASTRPVDEEVDVERLARFLQLLPSDEQPYVDQQIQEATEQHRNRIAIAFMRLSDDIYQRLEPLARGDNQPAPS